MSQDVLTYLVIILRTENEEQALTLVSESLANAEVSIVNTIEQAGTCLLVPPSTPDFRERWITLALQKPLFSDQIEEISELVMTGMILGFLVRGYVDVDGLLVHTCARLREGLSGGVHGQDDQDSLEDEKEAPLTEYDHYQNAIDAGTTEYYYARLRREAFRRDERRRSLAQRAGAVRSVEP